MLCQPSLNRRMLVRGVAVTDDMYVQLCGDCFVDLVQEFLELHRAVPAVDRRDYRAIGDVERCEQARRAVADVVVFAALAGPRHHRQRRLGALACLGMAVLVDA